MTARVMILENDKKTRELIVGELEKNADISVISDSDIQIDNLERIKEFHPEIVLVSIARAGYESAKSYIQLLMDDSSVRSLTLERCRDRYLVVACLGSNAEQDESFIDRILILAQKLFGDKGENEKSAVGKYILKGALLRCS